MSKPLLFIIIGIFVSLEVLQSNANAEKSKRLLLNDPDVVHTRLSQLEKKQQEMSGQMSRQISHLQGQISQQQVQISQLQGNISQQQGHISQQQGQLSKLQGDLSSEKTKTTVLEQTIQTMQSKFSFLILDNYFLYYLVTVKKLQTRTILYKPFGCIAPKTLNYLVPSLSNLSVPDEGYSRNASCELHLISVFIKIDLTTWNSVGTFYVGNHYNFDKIRHTKMKVKTEWKLYLTM